MFLRSIKSRLFVWSFIFISSLLVIVGISVYYQAQKAIFASVDRALYSKLEIVAGLLHVEDGKIEFELSEVVSGEYTIPRSGRYYKVVMDGQVFASSPSMVNNNYDFAGQGTLRAAGNTGDTAYSSVGPDDEPVRVMQHDFTFLGKPTSIYIAESIEENLAALGRIRLFLLIAIPVSIFIAGFVSYIIVNYSLRPVKDFSQTVRHISHKNLNERITTEKQSSELAVLAQSFNGMLDRLQNAFEVERRIISDASHELKTPLSVIRTQCEVILQRSRTGEEYIEALKTIEFSGRSMSVLVNNLLSLARLDSGLLEPSQFERVLINDCLDEAVSAARVLAAKKSIHINAAPSDVIEVSGSRDKLIEAFLNVIENGIRYNSPGGSVEVKAFSEGEKAVIQISDTGAGIEDQDLGRIFDRFYRADASRSTEGTGLGLSITKAIVEAHSGEIRAESRAGKGSSFFISIPLHPL